VISQKKLSTYAWVLVYYTLFVIVWGAWVRISHSGDGCGKSWPLCDGVLFPKDAEAKTWIEYFHRLTSGIYGLVVIHLFYLNQKFFPTKTLQRVFGFSTLILMIIEAALGAALVLKGLVGENATIFRLVVMTLHQINSLLLVGSTVALAWVTAKDPIYQWDLKKLFLHRGLLFLFIFIPATGAWAALSNTLFPSTDLLQGLADDFSSDSPWILKLRILHPLLATGFCIYWSYFFWNQSEETQDPKVKKSSQYLAAFFVAALGFGALTLISLSPVWMKLVHLIMAQLLWILLTSYVMTSLLSTKR